MELKVRCCRFEE